MKMRICIDPGHGGRDPGAVGPTGVKEKNVVLNIADHMRRQIEQGKNERERLVRDIERVENSADAARFFAASGGVEIYLRHQRERLKNLDYARHEYFYTRQTDVWLTLASRVGVAERAQADMFISLHCNGFRRSEVHGTETFFRTDNLRGMRLAEAINIQIVEGLGWQNRGIKQTRSFAVLRGYNATIPSVLVEFNFITNPVMENRLFQPSVQVLLADAVLHGINDYLT